MPKRSSVVVLGVLSFFIGGCQPQTTSEKVENKMEDAAHEAGQATERAGEKAKEVVD